MHESFESVNQTVRSIYQLLILTRDVFLCVVQSAKIQNAFLGLALTAD